MSSISSLSIVGMIISFAICLFIPILGCIVWKRKTKASLLYFLFGCCGFLCVVLILEGTFNAVVTLVLSSVFDTVWIYAIYCGIVAGIFEELGKYLLIRISMKKKMCNENAIMLGIGWGGFEAAGMTGLIMFSNLVMALLINSGLLNKLNSSGAMSSEMYDEMISQLAPLWETDSYVFFVSAWERVSIFALQIALCFLVFCSIKYSKTIFILISIIVHAVFDAIIVLISSYLSVIITEIIIMIMSICVCFIVYFLCKKVKDRFVEVSPNICS